MRSGIRRVAAVLLAAGGLAVTGCGRSHQSASANNPTTTNAVYPGTGAPAVAQADTMRRRHHSIIAGAAAGAVAGHMMGHHAIIGAATGAFIQHERNKHGH